MTGYLKKNQTNLLIASLCSKNWIWSPTSFNSSSVCFNHTSCHRSIIV